jgi:hypothetical protein
VIQDLTLRWIVTLLFLFSAAVCFRSIAAGRHSGADVISHSLHAVMAVAMAVMAWPRGADLPPRAPMVFFAAAALWFAVVTARTAGHRAADGYHAAMMLAMAWMYAAMGGLPVPTDDGGAMAGADVSMAGMGGGHAGHGGGAATGLAAEPLGWYGALNRLCVIAFAVAAAYWLYRFVIARLRGSAGTADHSVGILCQFAMAAGMGIMFAVML